MTNGNPSKGRKLWNFCIHPLTLFIAGIVVSLVSSYLFYELGKSTAIAQAVEDGRRAGHAKGFEEAREAAEKSKPKWIEQRYPEALELAKSAGRAEGVERGRREGHEQGRRDGHAEGERAGFARGRESGQAEGYRNGRDEGIRQSTNQRHAETHWQNYGAKVDEVAKWAENLEAKPGDKNLQEKLKTEALALVEAAQGLRSAYAVQANSFNSTMDNLKAALDAQNYPAIRAHVLALRSNLKIKGSLFLQANQKVTEIFDSLRIKN